MSNQIWKKLAFSILTTVLMVAFVSAFSQKNSKKEEARVTLRDVLEKTAPHKVRLKNPSKFEFVKRAEDSLAVRAKATKEIVGSFHCGSCAGGRCRPVPFGEEGVCQGCGKNPNIDCTIDPF
jgi:hypothetical protein